VQWIGVPAVDLWSWLSNVVISRAKMLGIEVVTIDDRWTQ
jgi:hypothetical protein